MIYENSSHIIIDDNPYRFDDIIGYELTDNQRTIHEKSVSTSTAKTSTGNMLGRAVVGGVLLGSAGAVIGGATANKNIATTYSASEAHTIHDYIIHISVNDLTNPLVQICMGGEQSTTMKIVAVLNVILERNRQPKN